MNDTSLAAAAIQYDILRKMSAERRTMLMAEHCNAMYQNTLAGIRDRHPEYTDQEARLSMAKMILGEDLFREAYGRRLSPECRLMGS